MIDSETHRRYSAADMTAAMPPSWRRLSRRHCCRLYGRNDAECGIGLTRRKRPQWERYFNGYNTSKTTLLIQYDIMQFVIWSEMVRRSSKMKPRFRAEWEVSSEELCILASWFLSPISKNSVLEKLRVKRLAVIKTRHGSAKNWERSIR